VFSKRFQPTFEPTEIEMPPRNEGLPEGTDHIVKGASETGGRSGGNGGSGSGGSGGGSSRGGSGFVASSGGNDTGTAGGGGLSPDRLVSQVREQVSSLRDQATDRARQLAEDGKDRTSSLLEGLAEVLQDAARSIDERLGDQYGDYAHRAGDAVSSLAGGLRGKTIEDLVDDTRSIVRKSPAVTVGTAALLGFLLVRLVKSGLDGGSEGEGSGGRRSSGGKSSGSGA
jgi:ElaB/YqjD/DUF883 family membrane-anchored ribosome-binding protein